MEILNYICCPECKQDMEVIEEKAIFCRNCEKRYKAIDGIPVLIDLDNLPKHLQKQIRYFERESEKKEYRLEEWQKNYIKRLIKNFKPQKNKLLVDIGTGTGYIAIEMAKRGLKVIASDLNLMGLIKIKEIIKNTSFKKNIFLVCSSAEKLPLKNKIADYIVLSAVLEHLFKEKEAIKEINRIGKQESRLFIAVPLLYRYLWPIFIPINYIHDKKIGHLRRYNLNILKNKFNFWKTYNVYYTGHFIKVIKFLMNQFGNFFNKEKIEQQEEKKVKKIYGASNIIVFFKKIK